MLATYRQAAYRALLTGMMLMMVGCVLLTFGRASVATPFYVAGYIFFILGSIRYVRAKGYSPYWGILGVLFVVGFLPLLVLRDRHS
jgi:uncharacterized membrane protein YhhN